jgi:hypothetical protein
VSGRTVDKILTATLSRLDVLEVEAARLVVLAKGREEDAVLGASASLIYKTVTAMAEDLKRLQQKSKASAQ